MKIVYKNLSANWGKDNERHIYIKSTDIEQKRWDKILLSFPDEALFFIAKGYKIVIEDRSSQPRGYGKIQRIFAPAMTDFLRYLVGLEPLYPQVKDHTNMAIEAYKNNKVIQIKYNFFKKKFFNAPYVRGRTIKVKIEPSYWKIKEKKSLDK